MSVMVIVYTLIKKLIWIKCLTTKLDMNLFSFKQELQQWICNSLVYGK